MSRRLETCRKRVAFICAVFAGFGALTTPDWASAQDRDPAEFSGLFEVGLNLSFDDLTIGYAQRLTTTDGFDGVRRWQHQLKARYDVTRWFRAGVAYRLSIAPEANDVCCRHRVLGEGSFRLRGERFRASARTRIQLSTAPGDDPRLTLRERLKGAFLITDAVRPFVSGELFLRVAPEVWWGGRVDVGVGFRPGDVFALDVFYRLEIPESPGPLGHVLGLQSVFTVEP